MPQFSKHYTRDEARELLPQIIEWLTELKGARDLLLHYEEQVSKMLKLGEDVGGEVVNRYVRALVKTRDILQRFLSREIQVKDLDRGLIDFPAYIGGKEVFLCWESGEEDIEFWHDLESGYAGREKI
ncbi:MAG TPA: DUF2203 domain-containing protein [Verrucomicrobiae bacterium]